MRNVVFGVFVLFLVVFLVVSAIMVFGVLETTIGRLPTALVGAAVFLIFAVVSAIRSDRSRRPRRITFDGTVITFPVQETGTSAGQGRHVGEIDLTCSFCGYGPITAGQPCPACGQ